MCQVLINVYPDNRVRLMDVLPKDVQLIVYRLIFDYEYKSVKEEYHRKSRISASPWTDAIIYNNCYVNRRVLSESHNVIECVFNFIARRSVHENNAIVLLSENYIHCRLYRE